MNESCHTYARVKAHTHKCVMSRIQMFHITYVDKTCYTEKKWKKRSSMFDPLTSKNKSHIWMGHVTYTNWSCRTYEWVMSYMWMNHFARTNELCYTWIVCVPCMISMNHVTHMTETCHTYEWVTSHIWMRHDTHTQMCHVTHVSCHTYKCDMSHMWMRPVSAVLA